MSDEDKATRVSPFHSLLPSGFTDGIVPLREAPLDQRQLRWLEYVLIHRRLFKEEYIVDTSHTPHVKTILPKVEKK